MNTDRDGRRDTKAVRGSFAVDDWHGFRVRFMVGALLGLLFGWRAWIRVSEHVSLLACMIVTALITGFVLGIAWRDNFWKRPI